MTRRDGRPEPWTPAARAEADQLHAEAIDAVRRADAAIVVTLGPNGAELRAVTEGSPDETRTFALGALWTMWLAVGRMTGMSPLAMWAHLCMRMQTQEGQR